MNKRKITEYIPEGTLVRAIIIAKDSDTLREYYGRIQYERYLGYAINILDGESRCLFSIDLDLMSEYHIAPALEGQPLFINLRIHPHMLASITPVGKGL